MLIDKDGSKVIAMPGSEEPAPIKTAVAVKPELMEPTSNSTPTQPIPLAPSDDGAVVDRRMMQRGFSHAFDELLQPSPPANLSANGGTNP